jgi:hypothetical protein
MDVLRRHPVLTTLAVALLLGVALTALVDLLVPGENASHAGTHLAQALPFVVVAVAALRFWPPPRPSRSSRVARAALVTGCALVTLGLAAEAVGAFGYDGDAPVVPLLTEVHNGSWPFTFLGVLVVLGAALAALPGLWQRPAPPT